MDRRKSIKALVLGTVSTGVLVEACETADKKAESPKKDAAAPSSNDADRMAEEKATDKQLTGEGNFFTDHETATLAILCDIIIPRDEVSGSATEAKVPEFIDFMMRDKPENQTPMRGGLRWLDLESIKQYDKQFKDLSQQQQLAMVDQIAFPKKAKKEYQRGATFFSLLRNFTVTGFYTSKMGLEDIGYKGNKPNQWNGVPADVLKQYDIAYSEKELKECMSFDHA